MRRLLIVVGLFIVGLLGIPSGAFAQSHGTTLTWTASSSATGCTSPCTFGYNIFRGTAAGAESSTPQNSSPVTALTYTDPVALTGSVQTFYYIVEAVETVGGVTASSPPSNEVSVTFPATPAAPTGVAGTAH